MHSMAEIYTLAHIFNLLSSLHMADITQCICLFVFVAQPRFSKSWLWSYGILTRPAVNIAVNKIDI